MFNFTLYVIIGVFAGVISGLIGIGGGVIVIPCLVYIFGFSQHAAQGTTLAMLIPPIGILAALTYYKQGYVNLPVAGLICLGFFVGGYLGAKFAVGIPEAALRKIFGVCLLAIAVYMIISPGKAVSAGEYAKDIEVIEAAVNFSQNEFPRIAYLTMELKNNGDKNIANLDIEISYYDAGGELIKKVSLKNRLTENIPSGEARKCRIRLKGNVFNERYEEYPYSRHGEVERFDVKISNVKLGGR